DEIAVMAGRGKTGRAVAAALASRGYTARPIGQHHGTDLAAALAGCRGVYLMAPNMHADEAAYVAAVLDAARANGISRIAYHSVAAPYASAMPHHLAIAAAEVLVRRSGTDWTILQPCAYMQNFTAGIRAGRIEVAYSLDAS